MILGNFHGNSAESHKFCGFPLSIEIPPGGKNAFRKMFAKGFAGVAA